MDELTKAVIFAVIVTAIIMAPILYQLSKSYAEIEPVCAEAGGTLIYTRTNGYVCVQELPKEPLNAPEPR